MTGPRLRGIAARVFVAAFAVFAAVMMIASGADIGAHDPAAVLLFYGLLAAMVLAGFAVVLLLVSAFL